MCTKQLEPCLRDSLCLDSISFIRNYDFIYDRKVALSVQCGWCKALNMFHASLATPATPAACSSLALQEQQQQAPGVQLSAPRPPAPPLASRVAGSCMLAIVLLLVSLVAIVGVAVLLPGVFGPWSLVLLHFPLAALLTASVLFSYTVCALVHPGR